MHNIISIKLPVGETLHIQRTRIERQDKEEQKKRLCLVTGIHGDEFEGQYIVYELNRRLCKDLQDLHGTVDIYPSANPLGMESNTRGIPGYDLDMNRSFPGNSEGDLVERVAASLIQDIMGANLCIDLHASNIFIREIPQARLSTDFADFVMEYAKVANVDFIWVSESKTVLEATLVHSLNSLSVPAFAIELGVGMRITREYGNRIVEGILRIMKKLGMWSGPVKELTMPLISSDHAVYMVHAQTAGIFLPMTENSKELGEGDKIGEIIDPFEGKKKQEIFAPCDGMIFSVREYPVVYQGSLLARILAM